jgi:hypothetical protein
MSAIAVQDDTLTAPEVSRRLGGRALPGYKPKTARDFEAEQRRIVEASARISDQQKLHSFATTVFDTEGQISMTGWKKIGQVFVGPILIRLKYEGVVRDLLVERPLAQGVAPIFPVKKDIGVAYIVQGNMGEVRIHRVEAVRVYVPLFRVASRPMVSKEDVYGMDFDLIASVKDDAVMQIREEEDKKYFGLVDTAITSYESTTGQSHTIQNVGNYVPQAFHTAAKKIATLRLKAARILTSAGEYYDFFDWGTDQLGWKARDVITDTGTFARYGDMLIKPTIAIRDGKAYVQPEEQYVGFMPVRWSLDSVPVDEPENGLLGFVYDELIGMLVANANGLIKILKA